MLAYLYNNFMIRVELYSDNVNISVHFQNFKVHVIPVLQTQQ